MARNRGRFGALIRYTRRPGVAVAPLAGCL